MNCSHHNLEFELDDEWLIEAGMSSFSPKESSYKPDLMKANGQRVLIISIDEIAPLEERAKCRGVFCDNEENTAKERVLRILEWIKKDKNIEPISVSENTEVRILVETGQGFQTKLDTNSI